MIGVKVMTRRTERLQEFIKEQVSEIIQQHVRDPRIGFVSITDVEVSADLRHAKIFVSVLGDEDAKTASMAGLESAVKFIRGELGRRLQMRYTPEIMFRLDTSIERGSRVVSLLRDVTREVTEGAPHDDAAPADRDDTSDKS